ncbi:hypothetical protein HOT57_gp67 [Pseudomonas phage phCDa]|uniref:Uncharacterized protein n=1 Tax=Pseudomonas phage phCDa TaxID=2268587 RepID=A0A2Z5H8L5_9CAUD|nr:hypothetical protein HOT57_gp67 [Pseudomonas phage phCDa]AXC36511.1 hypothetical protein phCDa_67 [Pseudomonas phage phCDa]
MKKAINKTERDEIIIALVSAASTKSAQTIVDKLGALRKEMFTLLHNHWQDQFPGISRTDQNALLQSGGAHSLKFQPTVFTKDLTSKNDSVRSNGEFGKIGWRNEGTDSAKAIRSRIATQIFRNCTGVDGVVSDGIDTSFMSTLNISTQYPSIIAGSQPKYLYDTTTTLPDDVDPVHNDLLLAVHTKITTLLTELRELVESAEAMYETVGAAIAPVKTAHALAELMPEAVKHFPTSLTYVKPTQEIADPKAINDIRAKLKAGLPI